VNDAQTNGTPASVTITVPKLGDVDGDGDVDNNDLNLILAARNTLATSVNDLRDVNGDGKIDALDTRILTTLCTRPRCATQ
jgi:amidase